jgi:hypothetical protein
MNILSILCLALSSALCSALLWHGFPSVVQLHACCTQTELSGRTTSHTGTSQCPPPTYAKFSDQAEHGLPS